MENKLDLALRHAADWRMEIVLKLAANCNLACDYCYFYERGNNSFQRHSALLSEATEGAFIGFVERVTGQAQFGTVQVDFHGGEPLLFPKRRFNDLCLALRSAIPSGTKLLLNVQTNGTLIDADWVDIFAEHDVAVGLSIDGPKLVHDLHRFDKQGRGSYEAAVRGLKLLQDAASFGRLAEEPAVLCVYDFSVPVEDIVRHLKVDLGVRNFNLLFDDKTHDNFVPGAIIHEGVYSTIRKLMPEIGEVRMLPLDHAESQLRVRRFNRALFEFDQVRNVIISVASNGEISPADHIGVCSPEYQFEGLNVSTAHLSDVLGAKGHQALLAAQAAIPSGCTQCCWRNVCRGGELVHRYSSERKFDNPSVYCGILQDLYGSSAAALMRQGRTVKQLAGALGLSEDELA